jgi:hypothetical protein
MRHYSAISGHKIRMDMRSIVFYLKMKSMKSRGICGDCVPIVPNEALEYSTVTFRLRLERLIRFSEPGYNSAQAPQLSEMKQAIL